MRILLIQESDWIKRGIHNQQHLMELLNLRGHEIHVIDHDFVWREEKKGKKLFQRSFCTQVTKIYPGASVTLIRPANLRLRYLEFLFMPFFHKKSIKKEILQFKPDVILCFGLVNASIARNIGNRLKIPIVYYLIDHLHFLIQEKPLRKIGGYFEKRNIIHSDYLFANNQGLLDYARKLTARDVSGVIFSSGVDLIKYKNIKKRISRGRLNIGENAVVLVFMGYIYSFSGMRELCEYLIDHKRESEHELHVLIIGDGDDYGYLKTLSESHSFIHLTGKIPFELIPDYLTICDIGLLPALLNDVMENIVPIKIYEFLAAGLPVISTDLPGMRKEFGSTSAVVFMKKINELLWLIDYVVKNKGRLVKEARNFISNYDWNEIADRFEETLRQIVMHKK